MNDLFGAAAARAQMKRAEKEKTGEITMENNALVRLMNERRAAAEAERERAKQWAAAIQDAFDAIAELSFRCGRAVIDIRYNGEVVFIKRQDEAIRLYTGAIRDMRDLQIQSHRILGAIMGC